MNTEAVLEVRELSVSYHRERALENVSFLVAPGQLVGIIGPNGAGKSTLLKAILGLLPPNQGQVTVWQQPVAKMRKRIAYVPQHNDIDTDFPVCVWDVVMMGRFPHSGLFRRSRHKNHLKVAECLRQAGMYAWRNRQIGELSGGQRQRVFLARALAQEAGLLLLDEPFAGIDLNSERIIINILRGLKSQGKTALIVFHDLTKAQAYFDSLMLLNKKLVAFGSSTKVLTAQNLQAAYEGDVTVLSGTDELMVVTA
jgi:iron/zinc/copper transport system ATP-binding protein